MVYREFAETMGFEILNNGEFIKGSWIKNGIKLIQRAFNSKEGQEIIDKGKKALELAYLEDNNTKLIINFTTQYS